MGSHPFGLALDAHRADAHVLVDVLDAAVRMPLALGRRLGHSLSKTRRDTSE